MKVYRTREIRQEKDIKGIQTGKKEVKLYHRRHGAISRKP